jgi:8-oxo-dGTP pyrophosphatase MutT (NUDIX family)
MPMSDYLQQIRNRIGHDLLLLPSAAVAVLDEGGRLLLGEHSDRNMWVIPGGLVEPAETPSDGAVREVFEETGLIVELTGIVGVFGGPDLVIDYRNGDRSSYVATVFRGRVIGGEHRADGEEMLDLRYFSREELSTVRHPKWMDGIMSALFTPTAPPYFQPPTWRPLI